MARLALAAICSPVRVIIILTILTIIVISSAHHPKFPYKLPYKVAVLPNDAYYEDAYVNTGDVQRPPRKPALAGTIKDSVHNPSCTPEMWSAGSWVRKANPVEVKTHQDAFTASGYEGCAWDWRQDWFLATSDPKMYGWRTNASAYDWVAPGCEDVIDEDSVAFVQYLVEQGGWFLIGDSLSEEHFFSLSCKLFPHVKYHVNGTTSSNHLFLNPDSPIIEMIKFPPAFDIALTPLVSMRRGDLMMSKEDISALFDADNQFIFKHGPDFDIWGDETVFAASPNDYYKQFTWSLPDGNYKTVIMSVGGHFSMRLFGGLQWGHFNVLEMFSLIARAMVARTMDLLDSPQGQGKEFVYRPYLPGNHGCKQPRVRQQAPLTDVAPEQQNYHYNWEWIPLYNRIMRQTIEDANHPRIHYLNIERPGRLRPETHVLGDCLHFTIGTGVMEGWTRYIYYYLNS